MPLPSPRVDTYKGLYALLAAVCLFTQLYKAVSTSATCPLRDTMGKLWGHYAWGDDSREMTGFENIQRYCNGTSNIGTAVPGLITQSTPLHYGIITKPRHKALPDLICRKG